MAEQCVMLQDYEKLVRVNLGDVVEGFGSIQSEREVSLVHCVGNYLAALQRFGLRARVRKCEKCEEWKPSTGFSSGVCEDCICESRLSLLGKEDSNAT